MNKFINLFFILFIITFMSCKKDPISEPLPVVTVAKDILTDASNNGKFTYFNFESGAVVPETSAKTTEWDFGLKFTTFIVNSGVSGPGGAGVIVSTGVFNDLKVAPETGYKTDVDAANLAIKDTEWYNYNSTTREFTPKAGVFFVFKTAKGKYGKMEIISTIPADDNGNTVVPPTRPTKIKYGIRYVIQTDGSRNF